MTTNGTDYDLQAAIADTLYKYIQYLTGIDTTICRLVCIGVVLFKIFTNHQTFFANRIWFAYFSILNIGHIIYISGALYFLSFTKDLSPSNVVLQADVNKANILLVIGTLFVDSFFGLFPNYFYAIYKTNLSKEVENITMRYFIVNGIIILLFFIVIIVTGIVTTYVVLIIIVVELFYISGVYIAVLHALNKDTSRVKRVLRWFFVYFLVYAFILTIRCILLILNLLTANFNVYLGLVVLEKIYNTFLMLVICLTMKDLSFDGSTSSSSHSGTSKNSSTPAETTSTK